MDIYNIYCSAASALSGFQGDSIASIDILQHKLVPHHEVLPKEEKDALLERLKVKESGMPKIFMSDPALAAAEVKPGDIIKITRKSQTAGTAVYYRIVVDK